MAKIFSGLFGRTEKEEKLKPPLNAAPGYDSEYIAYCIEMEQVVSALEENLHTSDDPKEIALQTLKVACEFYGGNWAGILEIDVELDVWNPLWWVNMENQDNTENLFNEFEFAKHVPTWTKAMREGTAVLIENAKNVKKAHPEEYDIYKRLQVDSVIGVPFGPNPTGFLAIRNPTRYVSRSSMMHILAYVIHRAMAQQKSIDSINHVLAPEEIESDKDVVINFLGALEFRTSKGIISERDLNSPKSSRVITYLLLNPRAAHPAFEIVDNIWPDASEKTDNLCNYIRGYIHTFRKSFSLISEKPLILTGANGYHINREFNIKTDLQQFDLLWEKAQHTTSTSQKADLLKKAVKLYRGNVFETACDEHWIIGIVTHYKSRYIGVVNELLATLADSDDYTSVQRYATRAIELTPENVRAYYWLIKAMVKSECPELAKNEISRAKKNLTSEEYASLKKFILQDNAIPSESLLDG